MIDLDEAVGGENFPDVPEVQWAHVIISANVKAAVSVFTQIGNAFHQAAIGSILAQKRQRSQFILWPPAPPSKPKRKRGPDNPVKDKQALWHNAPDFNQREAIRNMRSKQTSFPIGQQGCGFVWNRGRLSR
jgi:hypothetical protein